MNQRWTLHIENFARIDSADIEISPLLCFIGDNNSGKSYVMTLLWGLMTNADFFNFSRPNITPTYKKCEDWLLNNLNSTVTIENDIEKIYLDWFNEILEVNKKEFIRRFFNNDSIQIGKMEIRNFQRKKKLTVSLGNFSESTMFLVELSQNSSSTDNATGSSVKMYFQASKHEVTLWRTNSFICWYLIMQDCIETLTRPIRPVYLPTSRTGFLLARREISNQAIGDRFSLPDNDSHLQERLTAPYIKFLQLLNNLNDTKELRDNRKVKLTKFLTDEIFHGSLKVKEDGKIIRYLPEDSTQELPLSITSSVVTETASLFLLLTSPQIPDALFMIEEPEAHLHPALQKKMAQLLIRLVHNDFPVWITTHSDTILQHFNNMIKLNNRSDEDRQQLLQDFNYTDEDLLSSDEINLYQFERGEKHTKITKLRSGKYGFIANLFNKAIDELVNEIYAFQEVE